MRPRKLPVLLANTNLLVELFRAAAMKALFKLMVTTMCALKRLALSLAILDAERQWYRTLLPHINVWPISWITLPLSLDTFHLRCN